MSQYSQILSSIYNPSNLDKVSLKNNFVIRTKEFKSIFSNIKSDEMKTPPQHFIIQGPRGSGKTTLLNRLFYAIEDDPSLNSRIIPIILKEEQYNITKLYKLWENISEYLEEIHTEFSGLHDSIIEHFEEDNYEELSYNILINSLRSYSKKLILLIDNFGELLDKFKPKEQHRLREILIVNTDFKIIGGSTISSEFNFDYSKPFYEFFKVIQLKPLDKNDTIKLLKQLGEEYKQDEINKIINNNPGRVNALRILTGGIPRTIVLLFEIFVDNYTGDSYKDLEIILDRVTPLYKQMMDNLPFPHQEIVDSLALNWDAMNVKELVNKTRIESNLISAYLNQLVKNQIIIKKRTNTKNYLYQIYERFFNIWYLMRFGGRKEENKVKWLVRFLENWCDEKELTLRAEQHIHGLEEGKMYDKHALFITEALAKTSLPEEIKSKLISNTYEFLLHKNSDLSKELSKSDNLLLDEAIKEMRNNNYEIALHKLLKIADKNVNILELISTCFYYLKYFKKTEEYCFRAIDKGSIISLHKLGYLYEKHFKDIQNAEKYYLMAVEKEDVFAINNLALLYENEYKDLKKAEKYYLMAVGKENVNAMYNLALLYDYEYKDFNKAEKYYLMAIEKEDVSAMYNLALLYEQEFKDFGKAEKYYLMAIEKEHISAMYNLALLYDNEYKDFGKAEKYYLMAVEKDHVSAMYNLALMYDIENKDYEKAEKYYLMAVEKEDISAMYNLALLYKQEFKDFGKAEKYYLMAIEKEDVSAMYNLALLYKREFKDFNKAEKYYLMAVEKDHVSAMYNLALMYDIENKDYEKAEKYYLMAVEKGHVLGMYNLAMLYKQEYNDFVKAEKYYLMAVEKENASAMYNLALLYENEFKDFMKAEKYYLMAVEKEHISAMYKLAILYLIEFKDFIKAEKYFKMAIEKNHANSMIGLSIFYFNFKINLDSALDLSKRAVLIESKPISLIMYALMLLWSNDIENSIKTFDMIENTSELLVSFSSFLNDYLILLLAKNQYNYVYKLFTDNKNDLKDKLKPIYYSLMFLMKNEYPDEYNKMGSELEETVKQILEKIEQYKIDYK